MFDYQVTTVSDYQGRGGTEKAVEVFHTVTGKTVAFCRRRPFERKADWVARAFEAARTNVS